MTNTNKSLVWMPDRICIYEWSEICGSKSRISLKAWMP